MILAAAPAFCPAQVPANLLPTVGPTGDYVRSPTEEVKLVAVSESGLTLECTQESTDGAAPCTWRERYSVREGRLVLDAVFTPRLVPPEPARTVWQAAAAIGTSNVGPATLDPGWQSYKPYLQAVIEAVQSEWMREVAEDGVRSAGGSVVTVRFLMNSKGEIVQILGVHKSGRAPPSAAIPCIRAINIGSPYGTWTDDMVAALGDQQALTFTFYFDK